MSSGPSHLATQDKSVLHAFIERASGRLAGIRNGILIFDQDRNSNGDIDVSIRNLKLLRREAEENDQADLVVLIDQCDAELKLLLRSHYSHVNINRTLDLVARIEENLLNIPLHSGDFIPDVSDFIDSSFRSLWGNEESAETELEAEDFEVDEETLEIFRSEAAELLRSMSSGIAALDVSPGDREALWEIRRSAHTFKGAAGIVGIRPASELAHRVEDLLDKLVERDTPVAEDTLDLIARSTEHLDRLVFGIGQDGLEPVEKIYADFDRALTSVSAPASPQSKAKDQNVIETLAAPKDAPKAAPAPIVRVSLDRLDDVIDLTHELDRNRSLLIEELAKFADGADDSRFASAFDAIASLFEAQRYLNEEMHDKLLRIRLVRFGTLETRLSRAVHVTCEEEGKKAAVTITNGDCEIDTQIIDALIEPLLHLIKNAVVHGIEREETRRLIGKPERGSIEIFVDSDETGVTLIVKDDGRGISVSKLKEKAQENGVITAADAAAMDDEAAIGLIFSRGLTTADAINLNAGRGIGMSIVKESVEKCGGSLSVASEPQSGTAFTLKMPLKLAKRTVDTPAAVSTPVPTIDSASRSRLVLVVDDSTSVRRQTCLIVEELGYQVITAENGAEALELLLSDKWQPDLIVSDVEMPIMDGWELLEYVKTDKYFGSIPVVMVTSLDSPEHRSRAMELGASDYHIKPLKRSKFTESLAAHLTEPVL